jgi:hypothetical protein
VQLLLLELELEMENEMLEELVILEPRLVSEIETSSSCCFCWDSASFHDDSCRHSFLLHECHDGGIIFCMQIPGYVSDHVPILLAHSSILIFLNEKEEDHPLN